MRPLIYLDNNSTTPIDPSVLEAMLPFFSTRFGNPSNPLHSLGADAADAVEVARGQVASLIGAAPNEIVFTSGATESNNLALLGVCRFHKLRHNHVITSVTEHKAVLEACRQLEKEGFEITYLPVDRQGRIALEQLENAITPRTLLVSIMAANNEIGTLTPMEELGSICRRHNVLLHSDAVQALGRIPVDVDRWGVDLLSVSAHKIYGPKGVGALYIRYVEKLGITPLLFGGGQERGIRSGTLPVPQIVGLGAACLIAQSGLEYEPARIAVLRDSLQSQLTNALPDTVVHGNATVRLPGLLNVGFPGIDGDAFIHLLSGIAVSQGSSCSAGSFEPSHVLRAMGISDQLARASVRLGIGRFNTESDITLAADLITTAVNRARLLSQSLR